MKRTLNPIAMKKTIIALALAVATAFGASAANYEYSLLVNKTDGTSVAYLFQDSPVATIEGENLKITSTTDEGVLHPIEDLSNLTILRKETSGVATLVDKGAAAFGVTRQTFDAAGLAAGAEISIFSADGMLCAKGSADSEGRAAIDISSLGKGVYMVRAGKNSFKFIR